MDNFMTIVNERTGIPFHVRFVNKGEEYGLDRCLEHDEDECLVEFYDARYVKGFKSLGQFISRYYTSTLLETDSEYGLTLDGDISDWYITKKNLTQVKDWLSWVVNSIEK